MIGPTGAVRKMLVTEHVELFKGAEDLAALAREGMEADPFDSVTYVFRAKHAVRVKMTFWDETDVCLFANVLRWSPALELR